MVDFEGNFKDKFVERYQKLTNFEAFREYSLKYLRRSIRVNTLKISVKDLISRLEKNWILTPVPWCKEGFWIKHRHEGRRDIGNLLEHSLGYIYVQEAASMIPPVVLDPKPGDIVADFCASPGSKTTQIAMYMENKGTLIANDYKGDRLQSLGLNTQRCGLTNCITTLTSAHKIKGSFDKILVDAPCSGTGTVRKSLKTLEIWNPSMITRLASTQKKILSNAFEQLKVGGTLVYSTCSNEPEEDEGVIDHLLKNYPNAKVLDINLDIKHTGCILEFDGKTYNPEVKKCLRIWPQDNDTEGFFIAKLTKTG